jgi:hypothetical protein
MLKTHVTDMISSLLASEEDSLNDQRSFHLGSGSLAAMAVFESRYKPDMEVMLVRLS